jgi:NADH:ubiquinone oxidoreductase subunit 2 (subunit N)
MTLLPLIAVTIGGGILAWVARDSGRAGMFVAVASLAIAGAFAALLPEPSPATIAGEPIALTGYARLFLAVGSLTGLILALLSAVLASPARSVAASRDNGITVARAPADDRPVGAAAPAAFLLFLGAAALALTVVAPGTALLPAAAGGLAAIAAVPRMIPWARSVAADAAFVEATATNRRLGLDVLRVMIALVAAVAALDLLVGPADLIAGNPAGVGLALLATAFGVGLRFGSVPFHVHAIQLLEGRDRLALPLLTLWGPALFALAALAAVHAGVVPFGLPLSAERGVVAGIAVLSIAGGIAGALLQDDIDHVVAWSIVGDAAFVLLAFAAPDAASWGSARAWLVILVTVKSALLAWALAVGRTFGTLSLSQLRGWARRAPALAVALALIALATVGVPGFAAFEARRDLVAQALGDPIWMAVFVGSFASVVIVLRMLVVGLQQPAPGISASPGEAFRRPPPDLRRRTSATTAQLLDLNRAPLSAVLVLALAVLGLVVGLGLFGLRDVAAADVPASLLGAQPPSNAGPALQPVPTDPPPPEPSARPTESPRPTGASATVAPAGSGVTPASPAPTG